VYLVYFASLWMVVLSRRDREAFERLAVPSYCNILHAFLVVLVLCKRTLVLVVIFVCAIGGFSAVIWLCFGCVLAVFWLCFGLL
jgi:hypothetical protein